MVSNLVKGVHLPHIGGNSSSQNSNGSSASSNSTAASSTQAAAPGRPLAATWIGGPGRSGTSSCGGCAAADGYASSISSQCSGALSESSSTISSAGGAPGLSPSSSGDVSGDGFELAAAGALVSDQAPDVYGEADGAAGWMAAVDTAGGLAAGAAAGHAAGDCSPLKGPEQQQRQRSEVGPAGQDGPVPIQQQPEELQASLPPLKFPNSDGDAGVNNGGGAGAPALPDAAARPGVSPAAAAADAATAVALGGASAADGVAAIDIARDSGLALRLMDVLGGGDGPGQLGAGAGDGSSAAGPGAGPRVTAGAEGGAAAGEGAEGRPAAAASAASAAFPDVVADVVVGEARARMRARPASFCANCCAPRERLPSGADAACGVCGHLPEDDALLLPPRPEGGWGSAAAAGASPERAEAAEAAWRASALARKAGLPCWPPSRVLLAWHEDSLLHRAMLPPYPERPERLHAVLARLQASGLLDVCERMPVEEASDETLLAVHTPALLAAVDALGPATAFPEQLSAADVAACLAPESLGNRHTARAARLAAGAAAGMAERLVQGQADAGFALVRPAGHLSSEGRAEGGNLYNSVAVAARAAQRAGAARVMIIDWDAHAAKGTTSVFEEDPSVMVVSMHKSGSWFYPGGCPLTQVGRGAAAGTTVNIAWSAPPRPPAGAGGRKGGGESLSLDDVQPTGADYLAALGGVVLPLVREWGPDLILVSAGFDAAEGDPIGLGSVPPAVFAHMTAMLRSAGPPVGLVLEGGYVLKQTALCVELCLRALLGERPPPLGADDGGAPSAVGWNTIVRTLAVHQHFWQSLGTISLANNIAAGGGSGGAEAPGGKGAAAAAAGAGAAVLQALMAAAEVEAEAEGEEGEDEGNEEEAEWEADEDGEWEEDEVEAPIGPGDWAAESAHEV